MADAQRRNLCLRESFARLTSRCCRGRSAFHSTRLRLNLRSRNWLNGVKLMITVTTFLLFSVFLLRLLRHDDVTESDFTLNTADNMTTRDVISVYDVSTTISAVRDDVLGEERVTEMDETTHARRDVTTKDRDAVEPEDKAQVGGDEPTNGPSDVTRPRDFGQALAQIRSSSSDGDVIILVIVTLSYVDQASNFYVTSVLPHGLTNVLFVALDDKSCGLLTSLEHVTPVRCYVYRIDAKSGERLPVGSKAFNRMTNMKTRAALRALHLGHNVLVTDADVIYLSNPLPHLRHICNRSNCDLLAQNHDPGYNSGFVYVRSTPRSRQIYGRALSIASGNRRLTDQAALNAAIRATAARSRVRVRLLDADAFPVGKRFFVGMRCPPAERYDEAIVVHNNWIAGAEWKVMRARECLLWRYDGADRYYSHQRRRYVSLSGSVPRSGLVVGLLNLFAIGAVLGRTPILPTVLLDGSDGPPYPVWPLIRRVTSLRDFTDATGRLGFRESSFLRNPRVPREVRRSRSAVYTVVRSSRILAASDRVYLPLNDTRTGPTADTIRNWFRNERHSVIRIEPIMTRFTNLYYDKLIGQRLVGTIERLSKVTNL